MSTSAAEAQAEKELLVAERSLVLLNLKVRDCCVCVCSRLLCATKAALTETDGLVDGHSSLAGCCVL